MTRLETLEWLAGFVMACPDGSIPVARQQRLIREIVSRHKFHELAGRKQMRPADMTQDQWNAEAQRQLEIARSCKA